MKIAQIAPLFESVPPRAYGGTERVVSYLTEALVEAGHEVTLFASGDSVTQAQLVPVVPRSLRLDRARPDWVIWHTLMMDQVFERADEFDMIHFHTDCLQYPLAARSRTPSVTTLHGRLDLPDLRALHRRFSAHPLVSISDNQRKPLPTANWCATVHHGLPVDLYQLNLHPQDYFVFVGRLSPEKRVDRAIEIAIACGVPLAIAAKVDPVDQDYFEQHVRPLLGNPLINFIGEIDDARKNALVGGARALLFPIDWPEPFGLVMIEAMACGTPVVAYRCGSVPELMQDGITGYVVDNQDDAIAAARVIHRLDRQRCRDAFERRFTSEKMAARYLRVYQALIDARGPELAGTDPPSGLGEERV